MASTGGKSNPLYLTSIPDKQSNSVIGQDFHLKYNKNLSSITRASIREKNMFTCLCPVAAAVQSLPL